MTEIIDKLHPLIKNKISKKSTAYIGFNKQWAIYISTEAAVQFNLTKGGYLHFKKDGDKLYFYVDQDEESGLKINVCQRDKSYFLKVSSKPTYELLQKYFEIEVHDKYSLAPTNKKQSNSKLVEILLDKPIK